QDYQGPTLNITNLITQGHKYGFSVWVHTLTPDSASFRLSTQIGPWDPVNKPTYANIATNTATASGGWTQLTGEYTYTDTSSGFITIYVETPGTLTAEFYIDDVTITDLGASAPITPNPNYTLPGLKDIYSSYFKIGTVFHTPDFTTAADATRMALMKFDFNALTAEWEMKPQVLITSPGVYDFTNADTMVTNLLNAGFMLHGHTLVWYNPDGNPAFLQAPMTRAQAEATLGDYIKTVVTHFAQVTGNKVHSWDVVNEAINDNPTNPTDWQNAVRKTAFWYTDFANGATGTQSGADYIYYAFVQARLAQIAAGSSELLYYNDYNLNTTSKAQAVASMVQALNARWKTDPLNTNPGRPLIEGIGMQGHYNLGTLATDVDRSIKLFKSIGVQHISISELDISTGSNGTLSPDVALKQAQKYAELFQVFKANADVIERVTFWGLDDPNGWLYTNNPNKIKDLALLYNADYSRKLAYQAVANPDAFLAANPIPPPAAVNASTAMLGTPVIDGTIDSIWSSTPAIPMNNIVNPTPLATGTVKLLWDKDNLYALYQVNDSVLDASNTLPNNEYQQDSVEAFVDKLNCKIGGYQQDDGQYRVNFENKQSFNSPSDISVGFKSAATTVTGGYIVEMSIPWNGTIIPQVGTKIGFDAQINDAAGGSRLGAIMWGNDQNAWQRTINWGEITLVGTQAPVVVVPPTAAQVITVDDPFVHPGNSDQAIVNNPGNALNAITLNGSALNKYNKWMAQIQALLATTPDGLASSLTGNNLTQYNKLMANINDLVTGSAVPKTIKDAIITANDSTINVGDSFDYMNNVSATDNNGKGKDITNKVTVSGQINTAVAGNYSVTYKVTGANGNTVTKTVTVTVVAPVAPAGPQKCDPSVPGSP
ncbi:MAG: endo-1,4-beta-xylanase, partial [Oscillospiraceae bacterium]|nr:endo-1,4-beta-xylanase [Oscillospiraceae bacterium]